MINGDLRPQWKKHRRTEIVWPFIGNSPFAKSFTPWLLLLWLAHFTANSFTSATALKDIPSSFLISAVRLACKCQGALARKDCNMLVGGRIKWTRCYRRLAPVRNDCSCTEDDFKLSNHLWDMQAVFRLLAKIRSRLNPIWTLAKIQCGQSSLKIRFETGIWFESDSPSVWMQPMTSVALWRALEREEALQI